MLTVLASNPMLPAWLVLPVAIVTMLVISWHVVALQAVEMPESRRRIRIANGLLMLFVTALLAYALSILNAVTPGGTAADDVRLFVLVWALIMGLLPIVIGLAILDALNNIRLHSSTRRRLKDQLGTKLLQELVSRRRGELGTPCISGQDRSEPDARGDGRDAG